MNQQTRSDANSVESALPEVPTLIVTAHPEFLDAALDELRQIDKRLLLGEVLAPGIALCRVPGTVQLMHRTAEQRPIFVRHLAPVQTIVNLTNTEKDTAELALAVAELSTFSLLERGQRFAVQTRLLQSDTQSQVSANRAYSGGHLNQLLAEAIAEETGAVESIKKPQIVVSVTCTMEKAYIGISLAHDNLSPWPGGMRHFAQTANQISRAEFKLLEALEVFGLSLPARGRALD